MQECVGKMHLRPDKLNTIKNYMTIDIDFHLSYIYFCFDQSSCDTLLNLIYATMHSLTSFALPKW